MSESLWQRLFRGTTRLYYRADWPAFAGDDWVARIMSVAVTDRFHAKQGRSTGRWTLHGNGKRISVYLKRHYRLPWLAGWLAMLFPQGDWSPAMQEWQHLQWALDQGLPVPAPVAAGEFIGPAGRLQSFIAVEELADMLPLHEAIPAAAACLDASTFAQWKAGLAAQVAHLTRELHQRRRFHKDLYLCHFYIPAADTARLPEWQGRVHLIDLHRLGHHPWTWRIWQVKDLAQLLYSSTVQGLTARDRLRFWRHYLGKQRRDWSGRLLRWCVLSKGRRYWRHNEAGVAAAGERAA
jgi:heptose I phosphotransferase